MDFKELVNLFEKLDSTTKRLEKTKEISEFLKDAKDIEIISLLLQGRLFPLWSSDKLGFSSQSALKSISIATGYTVDQIEKEWQKKGDLGLVAEHLTKNKKQGSLFQQTLTVKKVYNNLIKLSTLEGQGTVKQKNQLVAELLTSATPLEARYIIRLSLEDLRIGAGEGTLRDSIVLAFFNFKRDEKNNGYVWEGPSIEGYSYPDIVSLVQTAIDLTNDFAEIINLLKENKDYNKKIEILKTIKPKIFTPIKVMLALKVTTIEDGFKKVEKPAALEYKIDGFRVQIHKKKDKVQLFTRRLEEVTIQFPDAVEVIKTNILKDGIYDAEIVGIKNNKYLPFQEISQRIRRKYDIKEIVEKLPVEINVFDILVEENRSCLDLPFEERRKLIENNIKPLKNKIKTTEYLLTDDEEEANQFYQTSLSLGFEGIMLKNLSGIYKPGARVGHMIKLKPTMEPLDLVIVKAEWGEGKRSNWLSSFTLACVKDDTFLEIGKVGTGFKEKEQDEGLSFDELTNLLKPLITKTKNKEVEVQPKVVVEVQYEEIQISNNYNSGYALRFPRLSRLRPDRKAEDASTLELVEQFFNEQVKR